MLRKGTILACVALFGLVGSVDPATPNKVDSRGDSSWHKTCPGSSGGARRRVLMGFRSVSRLQAERYMAAKTVTPDANVRGAGMQIGKGVYTTPSINDWPEDGGWYCAILGDGDKLDEVQKTYIPRRLFQQHVSDDPSPEIHRYIRQHHPGVDPERALLIAYIDRGPQLQMLIPFARLNANGGNLDITVQCADSSIGLNEALKPLFGSRTFVDYDDWLRCSGELSELDSDSCSDSDCWY